VDLFDEIPDAAEREADGPVLIVDVDGFEGPLDLLLELARRQKVDLQRISILHLAEQYLIFVDQARQVRLELAADYLVMAAWLAYLKSRLLLPGQKSADEPSAEEMASALARRLQKLEVVRRLAEKLGTAHAEAAEVFQRGAPEPIEIVSKPNWNATLYDLLSAYARQRQIQARSHVTIAKRFVWSLQEARESLERLIGSVADWTPIDSFLIRYAVEPGRRRSVRASTFAAMLELVREGRLEVRQERAFSPVMLRQRAGLRAAG